MLRYLNMFVIIGIVLVCVSIAGFATQDRFLTEAGQARTGHMALLYLGAGVLMLVNGLVSIRLAPPHAKTKGKAGAGSVDTERVLHEEQVSGAKLHA